MNDEQCGAWALSPDGGQATDAPTTISRATVDPSAWSVRREQPRFHVLGPNSLHRRTILKPGMCGPGSLFVGQIGDWTWETVTELCSTNVFKARARTGAPTYLAFYYFHIKASPALHLGGLRFGDQLDIVSSLFNFGPTSILTAHKISRVSNGAASAGPVDCDEFYLRPRDGCIYVETFNRWVSRSVEGSNLSLAEASPVDFVHEHLPRLPDRYSPRPVFRQARLRHTFLAAGARVEKVAESTHEYQVDITRDVNGAGLLYFAAYFSIIDGGVLRLWRDMGRDDESFLARVVADEKVCYLGNANLDSVLTVRTALWRFVDGPSREAFDVVVLRGEQVIAVSTLELPRPQGT